jgi:predicted phosphodiesterase
MRVFNFSILNSIIHPMRLLHFSDIHAANWFSGWHGYFDKRLLGALNYLFRRKNQHHWDWVSLAVLSIQKLAPEIVICSGDITSTSDPKEFYKSLNALEPLWNNPDITFIYVPGNHDHYIQDKACYRALGDAFYNLNQKRWRLSELPLCYEINNIQFLLVNQATPASWLMSTGIVSDETTKWLNHLVCDSKKIELRLNQPSRILIGHFPLFDRNGQKLSRRRSCNNINSLHMAYKLKQINVSLCGHIHEHYIRNDDQDCVEICAGSLTSTGIANYMEFSCNSRTFDQQWLNLIDN